METGGEKTGADDASGQLERLSAPREHRSPRDAARIADPDLRRRLIPLQQREHVGLGLATAKQIVESYGGSIHAANRAAGGAVFTVRMPVLRPVSGGFRPRNVDS